MEEGFVYCGKCGHLLTEGPDLRPLRRTAEQKKVAGVCSGVAKHFRVDESLVRVVWAGSAMLPFTPGLVAYLLCWAVIPPEPVKVAAKPGKLQRLGGLIPGRRRAPTAKAA